MLNNSPELVFIHKHTPDTYAYAPHTHKELEIGLCLRGKGLFFFGDKTYTVNPGDVFVVNSVEPHIAQSDSNDPSEYLFVFFDQSLLQHHHQLLLPFIYRSAQFENQITASNSVAQQIGKLIKASYEEYLDKKPGYTSAMHGLLLQICTYLYRYYGQSTPTERWKHALNLYYNIQPAIEFIQTHFREHIEAKHVANHLSLSTSRTLHLFKEALGVSFKTYITHLRIKQAQTLLTTTDLPVTEIALASGFQSLASFYRNFAKAYPITPQEYRKKYSMIAVFENDSSEIEKFIYG